MPAPGRLLPAAKKIHKENFVCHSRVGERSNSETKKAWLDARKQPFDYMGQQFRFRPLPDTRQSLLVLLFY